MGTPPTRIIIARHGARLDAADKNWHLTSPTPYDPPLSYGGWLQSRTLGAQIINLLQSQDNEEPFEGTGDRNLPSFRAQPSKRKRRIIVHSSPYLRCLQTAIAVSAGISQHFPETDAALPPKPSAIPNPKTHTTGKGRASVHGFNAASAFPSPIPNDHRCLLRVDAFLGEWLTSSYFEEISPPPKSERMITAAKAELLRRDSIVPDADINYTKPAVGHFPGGWGKGDGFPSSEYSSKTQTNPDGRRNRAASHDTLQSADTPGTRRMLSKINTSLSSIPDGLYTPPTPSYAISPSEPIPTGYVSHARDACVRIDYQWDSMREPQGWGNGGEYEEEWSTMNSRFGVGLERMVSWYSNHDPSIPYNRPRRHSQFLDNTGDTSSGDGEDSVETVLVIVTHGAGCNALISAIKGETTLVNVGTASLTMAVLKDSDKTSTKSSDLGGPVAPHYANGEKSVLHDYSLQLVASTEHLRSGGNPAMSSVSSPTSLTSPTVPSYRNRVTSRASLSQSPFGIGPTPTSGGGSRVWMMARPSTAPRTSGGLWGSMSAKGGADDLIPNFDNAWSGQTAEKESDVKKSTDSEPPKQLPQRTLSQRGLWGSAPLFVSSGWDKLVKVWELASCRLQTDHIGHTGNINTVTISPDGSLCASGGKDGTTMLWDLNESKHLYSLHAGDEIHALVFSPNRYWLCAATTTSITIFDLEKKSKVDELKPEYIEKGKKSREPECVSLAWSADGQTLFAGYTDNKIRAWGVMSRA